MNQNDIYREWQNLCDEHEKARSAYMKAFSIVNHKFAAIGQGTSQMNPTEHELSEFEKTWQVWEDVKRRMNEFVKAYA